MASFPGLLQPSIVWYRLTTLISNFNLFSNDKILEWYKLRAFADNKLNRTQKAKFALERVENNVGKGENVGYQLFLHLPHCFKELSPLQ